MIDASLLISPVVGPVTTTVTQPLLGDIPGGLNNAILTEGGNFIVTESGDFIVLEQED
jgi:hypothetical protein